MAYKWMLQKGLRNTCPKCKGTFSRDEYDLEEDLCYYCLFPEAGKFRPADIGYFEGDAKNTTAERIILDNVENIPEKRRKEDDDRKILHSYRKHVKKKTVKKTPKKVKKTVKKRKL